MADELDHFRSVCNDLLEHSDGKGLGICLRIVDGQFDLQYSIVQTPESLGKLHCGCKRAASMIEPSGAEIRVRKSGTTHIIRIDTVEIVRFNNKRVAIPSCDR